MSLAELLLVAAASAAAMLVKSVTGLGYPMLSIPIIATVAGVETAVVVVSLPNAAANVLIGWRTRAARSESRDLTPLAASSVVTAVAGSFVLVNVSERPLLIVLSVTVLLFVVRSLWLGDIVVTPQQGRRAAPFVGAAAGLMQGAVGVSGPVIGSWLYAYRLRRDAYIFSLAVVFLWSGSTQIATLALIGEFTADRLVAAAVALGPVLVMVQLGEHLRARLSSAQFDRAVLALLATAGVVLVVRVITG
ncbi:MAG: sulfite exporter TauE/SafE family protein [Acidimicrobiaceae bacterium]|nr:sulfite exporter TauE/SafE family protein [Acidimicrobiaceae bacterium]